MIPLQPYFQSDGFHFKQPAREALIKRIAARLDDYFLYGREPRPLKTYIHDRPSHEEIRKYRREHPSGRVLRVIEKHLARRRVEPVKPDEDIVVNQHDSTWSWQHDEIDLRAACFGLLEGADARWFPRKAAPPGGWSPSEGWLLVEDHRVVGAAEFVEFRAWTLFSPSPTKIWIWDWVWVDPEHRRKGIVSRRLPIWETRYGDFGIDQPNPHAEALLEKSGILQRHLIKGPSVNGVALLSPPLLRFMKRASHTNGPGQRPAEPGIKTAILALNYGMGVVALPSALMERSSYGEQFLSDFVAELDRQISKGKAL